jgi:hypothetical protein
VSIEVRDGSVHRRDVALLDLAVPALANRVECIWLTMRRDGLRGASASTTTASLAQAQVLGGGLSLLLVFLAYPAGAAV